VFFKEAQRSRPEKKRVTTKSSGLPFIIRLKAM
jgi:hypothetical protein